MRTIGLLAVVVFGCRSDKASESDTAAASGTLAAWGECGLATLNDELGGGVAMAVPPYEGKNISPNMPIVLYATPGTDANDLDLASLAVTEAGIPKPGGVHVVSTGRAAVFVPDTPYSPGSGIELTMANGVQTVFHTGGFGADPASDRNLSFERDVTIHGAECEINLFTDNFVAYGDVAISDVSTGTVDARNGSKRLLMSTGEVLGGAAEGRVSSYLVSQPFETGGASSLTLDLRMASEDVSDDSVLVVLHGPDGVLVEEVASVAQTVGTSVVGFPGLINPLGGDWQRHTIDGLGGVGSPIVMTLILSDDGGWEGTTGIAVDDIHLD